MRQYNKYNIYVNNGDATALLLALTSDIAEEQRRVSKILIGFYLVCGFPIPLVQEVDVIPHLDQGLPQ